MTHPLAVKNLLRKCTCFFLIFAFAITTGKIQASDGSNNPPIELYGESYEHAKLGKQGYRIKSGRYQGKILQKDPYEHGGSKWKLKKKPESKNVIDHLDEDGDPIGDDVNGGKISREKRKKVEEEANRRRKHEQDRKGKGKRRKKEKEKGEKNLALKRRCNVNARKQWSVDIGKQSVNKNVKSDTESVKLRRQTGLKKQGGIRLKKK